MVEEHGYAESTQTIINIIKGLHYYEESTIVYITAYCIAGNFCGDFNLANWRIFFTKLPKLIPPNTRAHVRNCVHNNAQRGRIHQIKIRQ